MTKKMTTKEKSPAPATTTPKTRKKASKGTVAKATPAAVPLNAGPAATPVPLAPAAKPVHSTPTIVEPVPAKPAVKAIAPARVQTKIVARADVGFGNALFLRGDGPGLSWNEGAPMECVAADQWEYTLGESSRPVSFKVLVNDRVWASGDDQVVASGSTATITPEFA